MFRNVIKDMKIELLISNQDDYAFPEFLLNIRKIFGTRKMVSDETQIPYHRLECLESGRNIKIPDAGELLILEQFFGLHPGLLLKKAKQYLLSKNAHCKHQLAM